MGASLTSPNFRGVLVGEGVTLMPCIWIKEEDSFLLELLLPDDFSSTSLLITLSQAFVVRESTVFLLSGCEDVLFFRRWLDLDRERILDLDAELSVWLSEGE